MLNHENQNKKETVISDGFGCFYLYLYVHVIYHLLIYTDIPWSYLKHNFRLQLHGILPAILFFKQFHITVCY